MTIISTTVGKNLTRNGVAIIVNKRVLECNLKNDRMISVCFQGKPSNIRVIQIYASTPKKLRLNSSMKTYNLLELTPPKDVLFIIGDWYAKVVSKEIPGVTGKFGLEIQN